MTTCYTKAALFVSTLTLVLSGCGESEAVKPPPKEDLVPVSGTVKIGGKPLAGVSVQFIPTGATTGNGSFAVTDKDGTFDLLHHQTQKPGAPTGTYTVQLSKFLKPDGTTVPIGESPYMSNATQSIPALWSDPGKAGEHNMVLVPAGGKKFDFDIPAQ